MFFTDGRDDRCWFGFGEVKFADECFRDPTLLVMYLLAKQAGVSSFGDLCFFFWLAVV